MFREKGFAAGNTTSQYKINPEAIMCEVTTHWIRLGILYTFKFRRH